ncbi:MAG: rhodanese-like domain-containing protein [Rhodobacteraceae bacterium]|nr:rhodanese-like domain-containing protein [Paracoccaceae bacterium]
MAIKPVSQLVEEARAEITIIPTAEAIAMLGRDDVLFVDIRDVRELDREGRIPGAFHAPRGMLEFWVDPASPYHKPPLSDGRRKVLFCASAWRSALSVRALQDMGVENVFDLEGGFSAWKKAGGPVETKA